jgi:hypothetical protein
MTEYWIRADFGIEVDAMLIVGVDDDEFGGLWDIDGDGDLDILRGGNWASNEVGGESLSGFQT